MKESKVLIIGLQTVCTETARHLVLSGINVHLVAPAKGMIIGHEGECEEDFLIAPEDKGKVRVEVVCGKL